MTQPVSLADHIARRARLGYPDQTGTPVVVAKKREPLAEITETVTAEDKALHDLTTICERIEATKVVSSRGGGHAIACAVAKAHGLSYRQMISRRRFSELVIARQHAAWEIRRCTTLSYPQIARILNMNDHTSIMHAVKQHQGRIDRGEVAT